MAEGKRGRPRGSVAQHKRSERLAQRWSIEEVERVQRAAQALKMSESEFVRNATLKKCEEILIDDGGNNV